MSTDDNGKGSKNSKPGTRSRKTSGSSSQKTKAESSVKTAGTSPKKATSKASPSSRPTKAAAAKTTKTTPAKTAKGAAGKAAGAGAKRKPPAADTPRKTGTARTARKPAVPDNLVQFPGTGSGGPAKKRPGARRSPAPKPAARRMSGSMPAEKAVPQALEAAALMSEEVGEMIGQVAEMALSLQSTRKETSAEEMDDMGDMLLGVLDHALTKIRAVALLSPPPDLLELLVPDIEEKEGYEYMQTSFTEAGDQLQAILVDVYNDMYDAAQNVDGVELLTQEHIMDELDEVSASIQELKTLLNEIVDTLYFDTYLM